MNCRPLSPLVVPWAQAYESVKGASRQNACNLEDVESALFLLALDKAPEVPRISPTNNCRPQGGVQGFDNRLNEQHRQLLHGGGSRSNGGNRWFDKTLQVRLPP